VRKAIPNGGSPDLSIIIPVYKEANRIGPTLQALADFVKTYPLSVEVIIVDRQSPDKTIANAQAYAKQFSRFEVVNVDPRGAKTYKGGQVKAGVLAAHGHYVMFMDADLATPLKYLNNVAAIIQKNQSVGICIRNLNSSHKGLRKLISSSGNFLVQLMILPGISDTQCGFKVFSSDAVHKIFPHQTIMGWGFDMEVLAIARQNGYQIEQFEVPDWHDVAEDSKVASGGKFSAASAALQTLPDVFRIKWKMLRGKYKKALAQ
jgi:dolichyl-phosphate beta-glucosyltransferase